MPAGPRQILYIPEGDALRDRHALDLARVTARVHEAMLTARALPRDRNAPSAPRNCWPAYPYEADDYGEIADPDELQPVKTPWKPTPRHIDQMHEVFAWYGAYWDRTRERYGLQRWEWVLLELRAWQTVFGRSSWRQIAETLASRPYMPTRSDTWCRQEHARLIDIALKQSVSAITKT